MQMTPEDNNDSHPRWFVLRPRRIAMLFALFVRPAHGLLAMQFYSCWVPALLCIVLALGIVSLQRAYRMVMEAMPRVVRIVDGVAADVAPISLKDGKLHFSDKLQYPYTNCMDDWQTDIVAPGEQPLVPAKRDAAQGLVVSDTQVLYWFNYEGSRILQRTMFDERRMSSFADSMTRSGNEVLNAEDLKTGAELCCMLAIPFVGVYVFMGLFSILLVTFFMFLAAMLLIRPEARHSLRNTGVLIVNCLLPPTVLSCFWYAFVPMSFDFSHIFLLAALAYLLLIFIESRRKTEE